MASSTTIENRCSQESCEEDINEHKKTLGQQLDELIFNHDQLQQSHESCHSSSMAKIDEWEHESIEKIHQIADNIRRELSIELEKHTNQFSKRLKELSDELKTARNDGTFIEIDLLQLSNKFNKLKSYVSSPPTIIFQDTMIIFKPIIYAFPDDIFELAIGDLQIKDSGQLVEHGPSVGHAVVRGSGEYSSGEHRFQFKIENYNINKWIFFGIVSHKITMHSNTWAIPSCYGWGGQDSTILNCAMHAGLNGYSCDFQLNDTIELLLDCDQKLIRLTNKRTHSTHMMKIDLVKCPFPWHFLLNIFYPNDRVRILYIDSQ
jgi:hypothetical protein